MIGKNCLINLSILFLLASAAFAGEAPYNPNPKPNPYVFCSLDEFQTKNVYFTGIFLINDKNLYPVQDAFLHFVAKKYSYKIQAGVDEYHMPVQCYRLQTESEAKEKRTGLMKADYTANNIDTGWTHGSKNLAEEAPSSAAPSSTPKASGAQDDKLDSFTMTTLQQDPRGLNLSPNDRLFVLSEAPKAKSYCAKDAQLSQALDCTCFVRTVFNYRIAHTSGPIQTTNFPPLATLLTKPDFVCSECVKDRSAGQVPCDRANNPHSH